MNNITSTLGLHATLIVVAIIVSIILTNYFITRGLYIVLGASAYAIHKYIKTKDD